MTSYILREPAYHKSAKLSAKLARIDNLGYASDLRLSNQLGANTYNQSVLSTSTQSTQTETNPIGTTMSATPVESTVGMTTPPPVENTKAFHKAPSVVKEPNMTVRPPTEDVGTQVGGVYKVGRVRSYKEAVNPEWYNYDGWSPNVAKYAMWILAHNSFKSKKLSEKGTKIYLNGMDDTLVGKLLYILAHTEGATGGFQIGISPKPQGSSTPTVIKPSNNLDIDMERTLKEYVDKRHITGTGIDRPKMPNSKRVSLHWSDKIMAGDTNYVLRNPFLNGRIGYYPFGAHMNQITIRTPSRYALKMIRDMVETGTFDKEDYLHLMKDEGDKMNRIIKQSGVVIPHDVELKGYHNEEVADLRQRYKVLIGEITAGNKGKLVLNEMRDILKQLESYHAISAPTRKKLLKQINAVDV